MQQCVGKSESPKGKPEPIAIDMQEIKKHLREMDREGRRLIMMALPALVQLLFKSDFPMNSKELAKYFPSQGLQSEEEVVCGLTIIKTYQESLDEMHLQELPSDFCPVSHASDAPKERKKKKKQRKYKDPLQCILHCEIKKAIDKLYMFMQAELKMVVNSFKEEGPHNCIECNGARPKYYTFQKKHYGEVQEKAVIDAAMTAMGKLDRSARFFLLCSIVMGLPGKIECALHDHFLNDVYNNAFHFNFDTMYGCMYGTLVKWCEKRGDMTRREEKRFDMTRILQRCQSLEPFYDEKEERGHCRRTQALLFPACSACFENMRSLNAAFATDGWGQKGH